MEIGVLCNKAQLEKEEKGRSLEYRVIGDPTEGAILAAAAGCGLTSGDLSKKLRREGEIPFSSERKRMSVRVGDVSGNRWLMVKGAADVLLERSTRFQNDEK